LAGAEAGATFVFHIFSVVGLLAGPESCATFVYLYFSVVLFRDLRV